MGGYEGPLPGSFREGALVGFAGRGDACTISGLDVVPRRVPEG
jgi:hypothetical protein